MELVKRALPKWILAATVLTVGILLIVAGASYNESSVDAINAISTVMGAVLIAVGGLSLLLGIFATIKIKKNLAVLCAPGTLLVAIGISLVVVQFAGEIILILLRIVPYVLIAIGALIIADSIFNLIKILKTEEKKHAALTVPAFILGAISVILGALSIGQKPVIKEQAQIIILGILLILYALIIVLLTFVKMPKAIVVIKEVNVKENAVEEEKTAE